MSRIASGLFNGIAGYCLLAGVKVVAQGDDILLKGLEAHRRDAAQGTRSLALEGLFDGNVASRGKFVELHAQVARRGASLLLDVRELCRLGADEQRHHRQSQLAVQQWI